MKGSPKRGVLYAFTFGMMPWAKESTRRHMLAYLRGVGFHAGIFAGLGALLVSPWWALLPQASLYLFAAVTGLDAGFVPDILNTKNESLAKGLYAKYIGTWA